MTRAVHPFDLPAGLWIVQIGQPMSGPARLTNHAETHLAKGGFCRDCGAAQ